MSFVFIVSDVVCTLDGTKLEKDVPTRVTAPSQGVIQAVIKSMDGNTLWDGYIPTRTTKPVLFAHGNIYLDSRQLGGAMSSGKMYALIILAIIVICIAGYVRKRRGA